MMAKSCINCGAERSLHRYWMDGRFRTMCSGCLAEHLLSEVDSDPIKAFLEIYLDEFVAYLDDRAEEDDE